MSENTVLLLPHQERFLQSRKNFPDIRWHFLLAGYGAGKSRSLAISVLDIVYELDNEKDDGGLYAKIIVGGYTYAHLEQTLMIDLMAYLDASKTPYHEDSKNHILTIGTVQVIFVQLLEPGKIFGQSVYCALCLDGTFTKVLTKSVSGTILYKKLKDISVGDTVLTRYGWRKVIRHINQGKKKVISRRGFVGTPDHSVAAVGGYTELQDLHGQGIYGLSKGKVKLWEKTNQILKSLSQKQSILTESDTTGIRLMNTRCRETISKLQTVRRCISLYGKKPTGQFLKDVKFITKTVTLLIMLLKTLSALQKKNTVKSIMSLAAELKLESAQEALQSLDAMYVERYSQVQTSAILTGSAQKDALRELGRLLTDLSSILDTAKTCRNVSQSTKNELVSGVEKLLHLLPKLAGSVLSDAVMLGRGRTDLPQSKRKDTEPLPVPFVAKSFRPVARLLDCAHALVSTLSGGIREVYDITVEDCHEFATSQGFGKNCDEIDELPEETMIEAMKSISQRVRQVMPNHRSPFIMAASTAQGMKGFYRLYCHYRKSGIGFVLTRARTQDNWYLPKEYILDLWKNFTETERKVYMEGAFLSVTQGRVIPGFDWDRNFLPDSDLDKEIMPGERVYIGQDFNSGYNRGSAWVARNGVLHCIKRYDFPDADDMADVYRYDFPEQDIFWLPDVTIKDQYPHFARSLRKNDIHIIHRSKSPLVEDSCFLISKLCLQGRVMIHSQAREVAEAFSTASRGKDNKIPKGVGPNSPIHDIDGARYVCSYLALVLPEFRDIRRGIMSHLASFRAGAEEAEERLSPVSSVGAGYTRIEASAFTQR